MKLLSHMSGLGYVPLGSSTYFIQLIYSHDWYVIKGARLHRPLWGQGSARAFCPIHELLPSEDAHNRKSASLCAAHGPSRRWAADCLQLAPPWQRQLQGGKFRVGDWELGIGNCALVGGVGRGDTTIILTRQATCIVLGLMTRHPYSPPVYPLVASIFSYFYMATF